MQSNTLAQWGNMIFSKAIILIVSSGPLSKYNMHWHKVDLIFFKSLQQYKKKK